MASTWWPIWLNNLVAVGFVVMAGVHLVHAAGVAGRPRLWHGAHGLMAVGMVAMTWPGGPLSMTATTWTFVFVVGAVGLLALTALPAVRGPGTAWCWTSPVLGLAAMAYMFAMATVGHAAATLALAGYFLVESAAWASGNLKAPAHAKTAAVAGHTSSVHSPDEPGSRPATTWVMRASLSAMGLGMAYMLVAMQFGASGAESPGVGGHHHQHVGILYDQ